MKRTRIRDYPDGLSAELFGLAEWWGNKTEAKSRNNSGYATGHYDDGTNTIVVITNPVHTLIRVRGGASIWKLATMPDPTPYRSIFVSGFTDSFYDTVSGPQPLSGRLTINLSDGTILATYPLTLISSHIEPSGGLYSGGGFLDLYRSSASDPSTFVGKMTFTVPPDVRSFQVLTPATLPDFAHLAALYADPARFLADWLAGYQVYLAREKARLQTNSTKAIEMLRAGIMPTLGNKKWAREIKIVAPDSIQPRVLSPFTVTTSAPPSSTTFLGSITTEYDVTFSRSVTASYVDGDGELHQETVTGTWRQQEIKHTKAYHPDVYEYINTYVNFPIFSNTTGSPFLGISADYAVSAGGVMRDTFVQDGLGGILNGVLKATTNMIDGPFAGVTGVYPDSTLGTPGDTAVQAGFSPPITTDYSTLTKTTLPLYLDFLRDIKPVAVSTLDDPKPAYSSAWLSTSMAEGDAVTLIPYGPVKDGEDLGMFASGAGAQEIKVYGVAKFIYHQDAGFTFSSWKDVDAVVSLSPVFLPSGNCLIGYGQTHWADVKDALTAQKAALAVVPPVSNTDKFLKLITHAAGV